jgi:hypothetical protein
MTFVRKMRAFYVDEIDGRYQGYRFFNKVIVSYLLSRIRMFQAFFKIRYANFVGLIKYSSRYLIGSKSVTFQKNFFLVHFLHKYSSLMASNG